jgi:multiple sugar transport system permease protein
MNISGDPYRSSPKSPHKGSKRLTGALRLAAAAVFSLPLLWMFLAALRPAGDPITASLLPSRLTLDNFTRLFSSVQLGRYTFNSLLVVLVAIPLTLLTASWAGFAMARLPQPARRRWVVLSLLVLIIPGVALWSSRFLIYNWLGITDTLWVLVAPALMGTSPFFVLMFYRAFRRIPTAVYESAHLDGAGVLDTWGRIALPMARPTAIAVAILSFILYWGDFISPLLYVNDATQYTLPVGLQLLQQLGRSDYPLLMAGAVWSTLAPLALVLIGVFAASLVEKKRLAEMHQSLDN